MAVKTVASSTEKPLRKTQEAERQTHKIVFEYLDPNNTPDAAREKLEKGEPELPTLKKSLLNILNGGENDSITRLAFERDPSRAHDFGALYYPKLQLIPDQLLKRISIQDSLVAAIAKSRSAHVSAFGREQDDRFSTGFKIEPKRGVMEKASDAQQDELQKRIDRVTRLLLSCGNTKGWDDDDRLNLSQFMEQITRDGIIVGRFAVEVIYTQSLNGEKQFHSFRPVDAATIYRAKPQSEQAESVRREAFHLLQSVKNEKLIPEKFMKDDYSWVQVIEGRPVQAFTSKELLVHSLYPVTDIELGGYPLTPLDTVIAEVTTHINITNHNKLYFQSGRATRGMLVIKSADVDASVVAAVRQQFNASINSVQNAWRMPVFGINPEDEISWQPIDAGAGRDMEFQYLADSNARVILSAFQMSPEELPGYAHLSRGTNNQALSEANNEYKLLAARDVGIRPLLASIQDFFNDRILPLLDPVVAQLCYLRFVGLDADTPEKETTRLQQDGTLHMTYAEILEKVEKDPLPAELGGRFPLNPAVQQIIEKYLTVGEILEYFFNKKGASKDPENQWYQNPLWFQWKQFQMGMQQMQMQQQQMQQQAMMAQQGGQPPEDDGVGGEGGPPPQDGGPDGGGQPPPQDGGEQGSELESGVDQLLSMLTKSEGKKLPANRKALLAQHRLTVKHIMDQWEQDSKVLLATIAQEVSSSIQKGEAEVGEPLTKEELDEEGQPLAKSHFHTADFLDALKRLGWTYAREGGNHTIFENEFLKDIEGYRPLALKRDHARRVPIEYAKSKYLKQQGLKFHPTRGIFPAPGHPYEEGYKRALASNG